MSTNESHEIKLDGHDEVIKMRVIAETITFSKPLCQQLDQVVFVILFFRTLYER